MTRAPIHPGEILQREFLEELDISAYRLARDIKVPINRISKLVRGERNITADTARRLGKYFDTTPEFWMNLQSHYELTVARRTQPKLEQEIPTREAAAGR